MARSQNFEELVDSVENGLEILEQFFDETLAEIQTILNTDTKEATFKILDLEKIYGRLDKNITTLDDVINIYLQNLYQWVIQINNEDMY